MARFEEYAKKYPDLTLERRNGIVQLTFQAVDFGGPLDNHVRASFDYEDACYEIAHDPENRVVIITGTGDEFIRDKRPIRLPRPTFDPIVSSKYPARRAGGSGGSSMNQLNIEVPVISAVNGPAELHAERLVLADIVLAAEHAYFQDIAHVPHGMVPGDGVHVIWPMLLGPNRGRAFLLTGQKISAQEALRLGIVYEVLPREKLLARAWELAEQLTTLHPMVLRNTRLILTKELKRRWLDDLAYGTALEGRAEMEFTGGKDMSFQRPPTRDE